MTPLVLFGCGGFAREVAEIVHDLNRHAAERPFDLLGYLDGNAALWGETVGGLPVLGGVEWLAQRPDVSVAIGVGNPVARYRIERAIRDVGPNRFPTLVHPQAWVGRRVELGEGTLVCAGSSLTCDIRIGRQVILNLNATVGHDAVIEDYANINPGVNVSGNVLVGEGADVGTGATIIQGKTIGAWSVVGAGAVVVRDLPPNVTAVGAPARPIKDLEPGRHLGEAPRARP